MIVNNDFYEHIWNQTHLTSLWNLSYNEELSLFIFTPCSVAKNSGGASTTLATETDEDWLSHVFKRSQPRPEIELVLPFPFPMTITVTLSAPYIMRS